MRIRIKSVPPPGELSDERALDTLEPGSVREVAGELGSLLIAGGWAVPESQEPEQWQAVSREELASVVALASDHVASEGNFETRESALRSRGANTESPRKLLINLPADLAQDLEAFCRAHFDAPRAVVIREAIRRLIDDALNSDQALKSRFLAARNRKQRNPGDSSDASDSVRTTQPS